MLRIAASLAFLLALTAVPLAQAGGLDAPRGKWWNRPQVAQRLNLTQEEMAQLDTAYLESRRAMIRLRSDLQLEQLELEALVESSEFNEAAVMSQFKMVDVARQHLATERFSFLVEVRKLLGQHRYLELKRNFKQFRKGRKGGAEKMSRRAPGTDRQHARQRRLDLKSGNL